MAGEHILNGVLIYITLERGLVARMDIKKVPHHITW